MTTIKITRKDGSFTEYKFTEYFVAGVESDPASEDVESTDDIMTMSGGSARKLGLLIGASLSTIREQSRTGRAIVELIEELLDGKIGKARLKWGRTIEGDGTIMRDE